MIEGGFIYGQQRRVGEVMHWQCDRNLQSSTKGLIIKRTNEHLHEPDEQTVTCHEV